MVKEIKKKKGEISTTWLITIILLILGFVILLVFLYNVSWNKNANNEVCHESVIIRSTLPSVVEKYVPLKCKTDKICITTGIIAGECESLKGETGITKIKVSSGEAGINDINKIYAQSILDCWSMMGEGKLGLFQNFWAQTYGIGEVYPSCVICDRIAFDKTKLSAAGVDLAKINPTEYMLTHLIPNTNKTYFQYIAGGDGKFTLAENLLSDEIVKPICKTDNSDPTDKRPICFEGSSDMDALNKELSGASVELTSASQEFNYSKDSSAILFMQISSPKGGEVLANDFKTLASFMGFSFLMAPKTTVKTLGSFVKLPSSTAVQGRNALGQFTSKSVKLVGGGVTKLGWLAAAVAVVAGLAQTASVLSAQEVTASKCSDIQIGDSIYEGCSVVRAVPYVEKDISGYCSVIESTP